MNRRTFTALLIVVSAGLYLAGCSTPTREDKATKVLMIGNSFSVSIMSHLPKIAADRGVDLDIVSLYIGGCTLKRHWENAQKDGVEEFRPYKLRRNCLGREVEGEANVCDVLRMEKWDIVTIQQASHESWKIESYSPYGEKLVEKIRELAPTAKIYVQETWSYTPWAKQLKSWKLDQNSMYDKLHSAYADFATRNSLKIIPFGTRVQEWRKELPVKYTENSFGGDVVGGGHQEDRDCFKRDVENKWVPNCDLTHLNLRGEYFQALVWAVELFDVDLHELDYSPDFVTEEDKNLMRDLAMGLH